MPTLRQRNLVCFYCGGKSGQKQDGTVRQWCCTRCAAMNYLDEKGDIADPPAHETGATAQYAQAVLGAGSAQVGGGGGGAAADDDSSSSSSIFCRTCLKNQHLLTETLAAYLPPATDPSYADYEKSYPEYRKNLERRYPQVCIDCEPRVRQRIRAAGYVAKTDHLRRMIERSRGGAPGRNWRDCGWRGVIVFLGGLAWWGGVLGQVLWHLYCMTAAMIELRGPDFYTDHRFSSEVQRHMSRVFGRADGQYGIDSVSRWAVALGLVSFWWNARLMGKLRRTGSQLTGLNEYYRLQTVAILVRTGAWYVLRDDSLVALSSAQSRGAHAFMLLFVALSAIACLRTVGLDLHPRITFYEPDESLVQAPANGSQTLKAASGNAVASTSHNAFPMGKLLSNPGPAQAVDEAPTPPADDVDAMDWTPVQPSFNLSRQPVPVPHEPTPLPTAPFSTYNALPPAPRGPAARLRNPMTAAAPPPVQAAAAAAPAENLFRRRKSSSPDGRGALSDKVEMRVEPPRLFMQDDQDSATTLQRLFDAAFSIQDEPVEVQAAREEERRRQERPMMMMHGGVGRVLSGLHRSTLVAMLEIAFMGVALYIWISSILLQHESTKQLPMPLMSPAIATVIAALSVRRGLGQATTGSILGVLIGTASLLASVVFAVVVLCGVSAGEGVNVGGTILLGSILLQRLCALLFFRQPVIPVSDLGEHGSLKQSQAQTMPPPPAVPLTFPLTHGTENAHLNLDDDDDDQGDGIMTPSSTTSSISTSNTYTPSGARMNNYNHNGLDFPHHRGRASRGAAMGMSVANASMNKKEHGTGFGKGYPTPSSASSSSSGSSTITNGTGLFGGFGGFGGGGGGGGGIAAYVRDQQQLQHQQHHHQPYTPSKLAFSRLSLDNNALDHGRRRAFGAKGGGGAYGAGGAYGDDRGGGYGYGYGG